MKRILFVDLERPQDRWSANQAARQQVLRKRPQLGAIIPFDRDYLTHQLLTDLFKAEEPEFTLNVAQYPLENDPAPTRRRIETVCSYEQCECHHALLEPNLASQIVKHCAELSDDQWINRVGLEGGTELIAPEDRGSRDFCRVNDADHRAFVRTMARCGTDMTSELARRLNYVYAEAVSCKSICGSMARHLPTLRRYIHLDLMHGNGPAVHAITDCQIDIVWTNSGGTARDMMGDFHMINNDHFTVTALTRHFGRQLERE